ncbi:MAG: BMP family ABC transporter substrate-binding protein [Acidimicrobiia bacterium]|nr:BMP family ABC transporter substrate-binding protein [Acidimicrobiia bacterium]MDH5503616.1 BMP family ABC transporter substrate-binding protein [Acidimicrobiia bacterium]
MKFKRLIALLGVLALLAAACGGSDTTTTTAAAVGDTTPDTTQAVVDDTTPDTTVSTPDTTEMMMDAIKTCLVTDLAGVDDRSFNASAWQGVQDAMAAGYATEDSFFLESADASDWQPNIDQMVSQGCQHIVTVGFALGEVTAINAQAHPDITWTMIDNVLTDENFAPLGLANVRELVYQTDEAAFAAGYLAAGVSSTGILCTYGGANFPTVSIFMDGFTRGAMHYNDVKGTSVEVKGWDPEAGDGLFTGSFTDMALARSTAESLFQENCDIIIPVGGAINLPAGDAINDLGLDAALIGVDADAYFAMDTQYQPLWLTTVEKAIAPFVTLAVKDQQEGTWSPGSFVGNLANDGVGLSPYHDWDARVSDELKAEVEQLLADIKDGTIEAAFTPVGY